MQLEHHGKLCFRKKNEPHALKQRPKHRIKVNFRDGISCRGATGIIIFTGNMNAIRYGKIFEQGLVPFVKANFPDGHRFQQDDDLKHSSWYINCLLKFHDIFKHSNS